MHKLLTRQLRAAAKKDGTGVDVEAFIAIVDQTYAEFDRERRLNDRAATLMEDELKTANEQAKREHDTVLAAILDNSSDGMLVIRHNGEIVIANAAAEKQFGAQAGGLAGASISALLGQEALKIASGDYAQGPLPELSGAALDGRSFPIEFSCADLEMSGGKRQLWMVRDISERVRAQREIMESRMRFQDFAEASSDGFWEMDQTLKHVEVSSAVESELVPRLSALLMPGPDGLPPPGVVEDGWRSLRQNLSARQRFRLRLDMQDANGEMIYVAVSGKPVFDLEGNFRGYRGTGRDVTREVVARDAARRAERRLIEAMDAAPCAVALVDSHLHLVSGNSALRAMASAIGERLPVGGPFGDLLAALKADGISPDILRGLAESGEMQEMAFGGFWYLLAASSLSDGGMVLTFSDVTALKQRERELAEAKLSAESASRLKSQFLATMSHELRTPLNAILGFSEVIRDGVFGHSQNAWDKYAEYAGSIHASGRHLLSLISEILDLSKIEAGSYVLDIRTLDLRETVEGALTIVSPAAEKAGVALRTVIPEVPVWLAADERAVRQIAINLLANAVKFTPNGGSITIEVNATDALAQFSVTDTGIGIAKEHVSAVFELFRQVDSSIQRRHEGTGLGLAITKRLVELHGGTIALESEVSVGTQVRVSFPIRPVNAGFAPSRKEAAA
ncbi:MAG TPA: ATP-binding protein [Micropepsaceae bacterium]|nr:ATP-binding protein [Micropepsaceae bacterium]